MPAGSATTARDRERRAGELELLDRLRQQQPGVVGDELERAGERSRDDHANRTRAHGTSEAAEQRRAPVADERQRDRERARGVDLRLEGRRRADRDEDRVAEASAARNAAIVAIEIVETTAMRRPPMIAGTARGSSTRNSTCRGVSPMPRAASSTSGEGLRSPATMFGKRMTSVYATSGISTVVVVSPVNGTSSWKSARLGIV